MTSSTIVFTVKVSDADGKGGEEKFPITEAVASQFTTFKDLAECFPGSETPVREVDREMMSMIVAWGEKHAIGAGIGGDEEVKKWEAEFAAQLDQDTLRRLLLAADFLDGRELVEFCVETVARLIRGKTYLEIRKILNIKTDFSPEQEQEIINRNPWAFE